MVASQNQPTSSSQHTPECDLFGASISAGFSSIRLIAHQGWQEKGPPNSLQALDAAFGIADVAECDVYTVLAADGTSKVIVAHPEGYFNFLDAGGMQNERPYPLSYEQTREARAWDVPLIPTLEEVLDAHERRREEHGKSTELHVELKGPGTAEPVIRLLQERIHHGRLRYSEFVITGLFYGGEETSRIAEARELDPDVRLMLVLRGQDLTTEGFADWNAVFEEARRLNGEIIAVQRRFLTPQVASLIKEQGFKLNTYHVRTSDELRTVMALGADYAAADMYKGPELESYLGGAQFDGELHQSMLTTGIFSIRDWIWEIGANNEKRVKEASSASGALLQQSQGTEELSGVVHTSAGRVTLFSPEGSHSGLPFEENLISSQFLGSVDQASSRVGISYRELLSEQGQLDTFRSLLQSLSSRWSSLTEASLHRMNFSDLVSLAEGQADAVLPSLPDELEVSDMNLLEESARTVLSRSGMILGMLGFSAVSPRHRREDFFEIHVVSPVTDVSEVARQSAKEQIEAQLLRSGKKGTASFYYGFV